ncbi:TPA: restriction endonuclease subunit S [Vibrio parahaemolyticus]
MKIVLKDIAEIRAGHPFRGAITESIDGDGYVIQIRDQNEDGIIDWNSLITTKVTGRKTPEWLMPKDVIFSARGLKNVASVVHSYELSTLSLPAICSPHYFQIRVRDEVEILPEFLAWQLNQGVAQRYFQKSAEGSAQVSIRRSILEQTPITVPTFEKQKHVVKFTKCARREKVVYEKLIELRRLEMDEIAKKILNESYN